VRLAVRLALDSCESLNGKDIVAMLAPEAALVVDFTELTDLFEVVDRLFALYTF